MTDIMLDAGSPVRPKHARNWLTLSAKTWFVVTAIGQWLFVAYILGFYGTLYVGGGVASFANTHLPNGYIPGDTIGNIAIVAHILVAGFIIAAGQVQLISGVRNKMPRLHRWSGRFYMAASMVVSGAGIYLVWSRERVIGSLVQDIGTTIGGMLVFAFVPIALYYAIKRDFAAHRRWALRLFMVVSTVWFLRLMTYGWFMLTGGIGIDAETFSGPFLYVIHYLQFLLPLSVLELYFWAQESKNKAHRGKVACLVFVVTAYMAFGIFAVGFGSWIPRIGF
ncbi:MAG: DUF2306 domain-containing protein [Alphaproteobacteria bacterium]|nr:DUF2306 domain-containing protein [Alphaproteobacteria bacterium]